MADRRLAWALAAVIVRYLTTIQPHAHRELARWRQRAHAIPDPELRTHVLRPFDADMSAQGAALFAVLAPLRRSASSSPSSSPTCCCGATSTSAPSATRHADPQLLDALLDALRPRGSPGCHPGPRRRRYLADLLRTCQRSCASLPSWRHRPPSRCGTHATDARSKRSTTARARKPSRACARGLSAATGAGTSGARRRAARSRSTRSWRSPRTRRRPRRCATRSPPPTEPSPRSACSATTSSTRPKTKASPTTATCATTPAPTRAPKAP